MIKPKYQQHIILNIVFEYSIKYSYHIIQSIFLWIIFNLSMEYRFGQPEKEVVAIENGGLFSRQLCQQIARYYTYYFRKVL